MKLTDIFVMASILECKPLGMIDAMAYGRPIVTTSVGGVPELIEDDATGPLCIPGDRECLTDKINA